MGRKVSILIPVIRPDKVKKCIDAIYKNAGVDEGDFEIVTEVDTDQVGCPKMMRRLVSRARHDLIMFLGDDTVPEKYFLKAALEEMNQFDDGWGVVGLHTNPGNDHAHWLAHKKILEHIKGGDFFSVEYKHCFGDDELKDVAIELGRWKHAINSMIEHDHPINKTAEYDEHYQRAYDHGSWEHDRQTYLRRKIDRHREKFGTKLGIAEPLVSLKVYSQYHFSIMRTVAEFLIELFQSGKALSLQFIAPDYPSGDHAESIAGTRNNLIEQSLFLGCTHTLMVDTDQIYESPRLISQLLSHGKDVVGARVHRRYPPFDPLLLDGDDTGYFPFEDDVVKEAMETGELVKVKATGCGCVLYDNKVFFDIERPWFEHTINSETGRPVGEDVGFCEKLREAGFDIYVDCKVDIKHLTLSAIDWDLYKVWSKIHGAKKPRGD